MAHRRWQIGLGFVFLAAIASNYGGCECDPAGVECVTPLDCETKSWSNGNCDQSEGRWECQDRTCVAVCPGECQTAEDCEGNAWPGGVGCLEEEGNWMCQDTFCVAVCDEDCALPIDCAANAWTEPCVGHFDCAQGTCAQVCDDVGCGDETCSAEGGETRESCPPDCDEPCAALVDCLGREWNAGCEGRWDCEAQACVEVCDYDSCGDAVCSPALGEDEQTCPRDCLEGCTLPTDCYLELWGQICQGRWNCSAGECMEVCDNDNCGDGVCWGLNGENEDSCFVDCLGGPCEALIDCFAHRWYEDFGGYWQCNEAMPPGQLTTGACEAIRDDVGCGDDTCDVLGGETPVSCVADCSDYSCTKSEDCNTLTLPGSCTSWICSNLVCVPQCG